VRNRAIAAYNQNHVSIRDLSIKNWDIYGMRWFQVSHNFLRQFSLFMKGVGNMALGLSVLFGGVEVEAF